MTKKLKETKIHPNLDVNYFSNIDNKEKAYWLGMLYADGNVHKRSNNWFEVHLGVNKKDKILINRFANAVSANKEKIKYRKDGIVYLRINNKKLATDLISHGCIPNKSKTIELPNLEKKDLSLAFLLGYFDGDGTANTTKITSGSLNFLKQIKNQNEIPNKITQEGSKYKLHLGAKVFNKMMDNYKNSLQRKRRHFLTKEERIELGKKNTGKIKFEVSKDELEKLVWEMSTTKVAEMYGVSDKAIEKRCKKYGIEKPPRGYWQKKKNNMKRTGRISRRSKSGAAI